MWHMVLYLVPRARCKCQQMAARNFRWLACSTHEPVGGVPLNEASAAHAPPQRPMMLSANCSSMLVSPT